GHEATSPSPSDAPRTTTEIIDDRVESLTQSLCASVTKTSENHQTPLLRCIVASRSPGAAGGSTMRASNVRGLYVALAVITVGLTVGAPAPAVAATVSNHVAYVNDIGSGSDDASFPGSSIFVNALTGVTVPNGGTY